ncbi:MAG: RNA polymerase factor sigma-54 [Pseudomonadota bacterium]
MALSPRLEVKQTQQLRMTPQLRQAIHLLQLTNLELTAVIRAEAERNPLIELDEGSSIAAPKAEAPETTESHLTATNPGNASEEFDTGRQNIYDEAPADRAERMGTDFARGGEEDPGELQISKPPNLRDHLVEQISIDPTGTPQAKTIALALVDELNIDGYLAAPLFEIADRYGVTTGELEGALALLQACEPAGIGARDLSDCLRLQLQDQGDLSPELAALLENLDMIAAGKIRELAKLCDTTPDALPGLLSRIRLLDPRPGRAFSFDPVEQAVPDVFIRANAAGGWSVELNTETMPRVVINNSYARQLSAEGEEVETFISECRTSASWLTRAIDQRARTILNTASAIAKHQDGFFRDGLRALRPLTMSTIAEEIDVHESTISRVVNNKFLHCDRGTFELKFFFMQALRDTSGEANLAAVAVQDQIKQLIDKENPAKPLSDDKILALLKADGVDIARRTIAKYREAMGIPSSVQRRREKAGLNQG